MVHVGACARRFPLDDVDLHVLDFDSHQQEVYLPHNDIFQVVSGEEKVKKIRCAYSSQPFVYFQAFLVSGEGTLLCVLAKGGVTVHTHPHPTTLHGSLISQHVFYLNQSNFCPSHSPIYSSKDVLLVCYVTHSCLLTSSICSVL